MAQNVTLTTYRGDDDAWIVTVTDSLTLAAIDLTNMATNGMKFWFTVKQELPQPDAGFILIQKTSAWVGHAANGITLVDGPTGKIKISIQEADTEKFLAPVTFQYDLRFKNSDNTITTIALGAFQILGNVTRTVS